MTEGFHVDASAVAGLGKLMERAGGAAGVFAAQNTGAGPNALGEGVLINVFGKVLDRWQELVVRNANLASTTANGAAMQLAAAATMYADTDTATALHLDMLYPGAEPKRVSPEEVSTPETSQDFSDTEDASADPWTGHTPYGGPPPITEDQPPPAGPRGSTHGLGLAIEKEIEKLTGMLSLAPVARALLERIVGLDLLSVAVTIVSGDWKLLLTQSMTFEDTGIAFRRIKTNVDRGRYAIQDRWNGNAASTAEAWHAAYSSAAGTFATFCTEAGWKIGNFARAAYHQFVALNIAVDFLLDQLFDLLLRAGKGGVGGMVVDIFSGGLEKIVAAVVAAYGPVADILDALRALGHAIAAAIELVAANGEIAAKAWPPEPYRHPGVTVSWPPFR